MKHDFNQRKQRRIQSAGEKAVKAEAASRQQYQQVREMASAIPLGQPILVGHHSEQRDRSFRKRIHQKFGKAVQLQDKADYYREKARTIAGNQAIFSDDPQALDKLRGRLKELQDNQHFMKQANQCIKKKDREAFLALPHATGALWAELARPDKMGVTGFAPYSLRNNNATIRRLQRRIEQLQRLEAAPVIDEQLNGLCIFQNNAAGRLQMLFSQKPPQELIAELKRHGFRWCRSQQAWQRHISPNAIYCARLIAGKFGER